ncbi:putative secreted acid phosphatase [Friedmanniella endophytica]|uniref:Putative secreted acid phosphatase n=1 Tax=Microlunatus kandeliicorticis TaxID=1759536 RepID=A0A7W3IQG5_9ACTN|nr:HAD family acid phosphatase [Microlunatus kandeliicorticis]MBA8793357.1 putative secreted acid phosphatase [Microlunatus kandeliicorticis]
MPSTSRSHTPVRTLRRRVAAVGLAATLVGTGLGLGTAGPAAARTTDPAAARTTDPAAARTTTTAAGASSSPLNGRLTPRTHFTMQPDGSSGRRADGAGIPNIDSVKKTIATYYGDPGTGIADKTSSPYITQMTRITDRQQKLLKTWYRQAKREGRKPAIVLDTDDTTLWTYDMEVAAMHFVFDPTLQNQWVQDERFPAVPGMVRLVAAARAMGYTVFGITGRNDDQKAASIANLDKVGITAFDRHPGRYYTKWTGTGSSKQPSYLTCVSTCTTVEYKAGTRKHIQELGYTIVANYGDQWSDLQGGYARHSVKLPNPTYYLPSPNLPGLDQPKLSPRTHFTMKPDGSSGKKPDGEGIPNIDSVKKTIYTYDNDPGTGIADKTASPYITEMARIERKVEPVITRSCRAAVARGDKPAVVLDTDDTTLWTYDMEVAAMKFVFDPKLQDVYVQDQRFPATPSMVVLATAAKKAGCTLIGLTGRNDDQKAASLANLAKVGYPMGGRGFTAANYYTKWTGVGSSQQPSYISCATAKCTTVEYKSQTRRHIESAAGGGYDIVANLGDQFSDLQGGYADRTVKLPNPTYYLP